MSKLNEIILDTLEKQGDVFTLDEMAGHIESALLNGSGGPDHIIGITSPDWTIQHPLNERFEGSLMDCPYTHFGAVTAEVIHKSEGDGRFRVWRDRGALQWERVGE